MADRIYAELLVPYDSGDLLDGDRNKDKTTLACRNIMVRMESTETVFHRVSLQCI